MFQGFSSKKLKPQLKMAVNRIQIASNKKAALLKQNLRETAVMLAEDPPKEEKARIRAEALIRDDQMIEAFEILQLQCELLHERIKLIEYTKGCPPDLVPVVSTLIWAAHRVDIPELMLVRKQFRAKYGKQFEDDALTNANGVLNERVVTKLSVNPPAAYLVQTYLERICEQFEVDWTPRVKLSTNEMIEPMAAPVGYSVQVAQGTGLGNVVAVTGEELPFGAEHKENRSLGPVPPPIVQARPFNPNDATNNGDDFIEEDIFIPGAPSAPPGSNLTSPSNTTLGGETPNKKDNHDDEDNGDDDNDDDDTQPAGGGSSAGGGGGKNTASYDDLAARFNQLGK